MLAGAGDMEFSVDGSFMGIRSLYDFEIQGTSTNAGLLGLDTVDAGYDVWSQRLPEEGTTVDLVAEEVFDEVLMADRLRHGTAQGWQCCNHVAYDPQGVNRLHADGSVLWRSYRQCRLQYAAVHYSWAGLLEWYW